MTPTDREQLFSRRYFDSGLTTGGGYHAYWDFPAHEATARHVLSRRPKSVIEIGGGRGYVMKRLHDAGVPGVCIDISKHCELSAVCEGFVRHDVCEAPWPLPLPKTGYPNAGHVEQYDLALSLAVLELIPEEHVPAVCAELARVSQRGLHGVDFGPGDGRDCTKVNLKPRSWWVERLPPGHEVVDKDELERGEIPEAYWKGDGKVKLNIGCGPLTMFHHGWTNLDVLDFTPYAQQGRYAFQVCDVRQGLPYNTGSVDAIYCSHMLEHVTYAEGLSFLRECRRVLKPESGAIRVAVPDAEWLMGLYFDESDGCSLDDFDELNADCAESPSGAGKLYALLHGHHLSQYDHWALKDAMRKAGFQAEQVGFRKTFFGTAGCKDILRTTLDFLPSLTLTAEGVPLVG